MPWSESSSHLGKSQNQRPDSDGDPDGLMGPVAYYLSPYAESISSGHVSLIHSSIEELLVTPKVATTFVYGCSL